MGSAYGEETLARSAAVRRLALRLPADPDRLSDLRHRLTGFLAAHGVSDRDAFDLVVAVSEAAANAMEHPVHPREAAVEVIVEIDGDVVTVTVRDTGRWRRQRASVVRGRGLSLIKALVDLDVRSEDRGTTLVLSRRVPRHPPGRPAAGR